MKTNASHTARKLTLCLTLPLAALGVAQAAAPVVEVWKTPSCGCCGKWVDHMKQAGFALKVHDVPETASHRKAAGIPEALGSCHTARVAGYALEGHVPASDVKRLLREKPKALGLAVPGMPPNSPGMDLPSTTPYETRLIGTDGKSSVYATHGKP